MVGYVRRLILRSSQSLANDAIFRRILTNSGWLLGASGVAIPMGIAQSVLVARLLGVEQYGVLGVIITFVSVAKRLTSFRMNEFVVKYLSDALVKKRLDLASATLKAAMLAEAGTSLLAFAVTCLLAPLAVRWFVHDTGAQVLIYSYALVILGNMVSESATGALQVFDRFRLQATTTAAGRALTLGGVTIAYLMQGGLREVVLAYLVGNIVPALFLVIYTLREITHQLGFGWWRISLGILRGRLSLMIKFALTTNIGATLSLIVKDSDLLWLAYFRNTTEVGYYKLAMSLLGLVLIPGTPMVKAIYPEIARTIAAGDDRQTKRLLFKGTMIASIWVIPIGLGFLLSSPWLITNFYGAEFVPSVPALGVLLVGIGFANIVFWTRPAMLSLGRPDFALKITVLHTILKIPLVLLLVPAGGYVMMAGILSGLYVLGGCLASSFVLYHLGLLHSLPQQRIRRSS